MFYVDLCFVFTLYVSDITVNLDGFE